MIDVLVYGGGISRHRRDHGSDRGGVDRLARRAPGSRRTSCSTTSTPATIGVQGSGRTTQSVVTVIVRDRARHPFARRSGAVLRPRRRRRDASPEQTTTDSDGNAKVTVQAGTLATAVQLTAAVDVNNDGSFRGGQPVHAGEHRRRPAKRRPASAWRRSSSTSPAASTFGIEDEITAFMNDHFGNAVAAGHGGQLHHQRRQRLQPGGGRRAGRASTHADQRGRRAGGRHRHRARHDARRGGVRRQQRQRRARCRRAVHRCSRAVHRFQRQQPLRSARAVHRHQQQRPLGRGRAVHRQQRQRPLRRQRTTSASSTSTATTSGTRRRRPASGTPTRCSRRDRRHVLRPTRHVLLDPRSFVIHEGGSQHFTLFVGDRDLNPLVGGSQISVSVGGAASGAGSIVGVPDVIVAARFGELRRPGARAQQLRLRPGPDRGPDADGASTSVNVSVTSSGSARRAASATAYVRSSPPSGRVIAAQHPAPDADGDGNADTHGDADADSDGDPHRHLHRRR